MRLKALLLVLIFALSIPSVIFADDCDGGFDIGHLNIGGQCKSNTIDPAMKSDIYRVMATAAASVNDLPEQVRASGPNGQSVVPSTAGAAQIFSYGKWMFSSATAQELLGRSLGPIGETLMTALVLIMVLVALYFVIRIAALIIKAVSWVINQILKLIPFW